MEIWNIMKIEGINIGIRKFQSNDSENFQKAVKESFEHMREFMPWCHSEYSLQESKAWVESRKEAWDSGQDYSFIIYSKSDNSLLGGVDINLIINQHKVANIGYWIRKTALNQGVATEAVKLILGFGFNTLEMNRLEIITLPNNHASRKVAEKVGAKYDGLLEKRLVVYDKAMDACMYSIVKGKK